MPAIETTISTDRPQRYLKQLSQHAAAMVGDHSRHRPMHVDPTMSDDRPELHVAASDKQVLLTFGSVGSCTVTRSADGLHVRIEAADDDALQRIQQIITNDLQRFGHREQLLLDWHTATREGT